MLVGGGERSDYPTRSKLCVRVWVNVLVNTVEMDFI